MHKIHLSNSRMQAALMEGRRQRSAQAHRLFRRLWRRLRLPFGYRSTNPSACAGCTA